MLIHMLIYVLTMILLVLLTLTFLTVIVVSAMLVTKHAIFNSYSKHKSLRCRLREYQQSKKKVVNEEDEEEEEMSMYETYSELQSVPSSAVMDEEDE